MHTNRAGDDVKNIVLCTTQIFLYKVKINQCLSFHFCGKTHFLYGSVADIKDDCAFHPSAEFDLINFPSLAQTNAWINEPLNHEVLGGERGRIAVQASDRESGSPSVCVYVGVAGIYCRSDYGGHAARRWHCEGGYGSARASSPSYPLPASTPRSAIRGQSFRNVRYGHSRCSCRPQGTITHHVAEMRGQAWPPRGKEKSHYRSDPPSSHCASPFSSVLAVALYSVLGDVGPVVVRKHIPPTIRRTIVWTTPVIDIAMHCRRVEKGYHHIRDVRWMFQALLIRMNHFWYTARDTATLKGAVTNTAANNSSRNSEPSNLRFMCICNVSLSCAVYTLAGEFEAPAYNAMFSSTRIRLKRASQKQSCDTYKTPYEVKRYRERKKNIKASDHVNVHVFKQNDWSCPQYSHTPLCSFFLNFVSFPSRMLKAYGNKETDKGFEKCRDNCETTVLSIPTQEFTTLRTGIEVMVSAAELTTQMCRRPARTYTHSPVTTLRRAQYLQRHFGYPPHRLQCITYLEEQADECVKQIVTCKAVFRSANYRDRKLINELRSELEEVVVCNSRIAPALARQLASLGLQSIVQGVVPPAATQLDLIWIEFEWKLFPRRRWAVAITSPHHVHMILVSTLPQHFLQPRKYIRKTSDTCFWDFSLMARCRNYSNSEWPCEVMEMASLEEQLFPSISETLILGFWRVAIEKYPDVSVHALQSPSAGELEPLPEDGNGNACAKRLDTLTSSAKRPRPTKNGCVEALLLPHEAVRAT
ncbi:hypothetical protein PR048_008827 [Dryococelus australis]|uniref:Uncharacterized protein n=1 Tax=Dryococelus australis TaxID=614101 RepID=A0ABQ9I009_9NEOP|nr:hypothetical protein PR048_008827 [Dryococelus australis]